MAAIDLPDPPFAAETEDTIRARMLTWVSDSLSKDQGDIVWDMLTPAAIEIDRLYDQIEFTVEQCFAATATGTYLDALGQMYAGMARDVDEPDDAYRNRLLTRIQAPVGAGSDADYRTWALEAHGDIAFAGVEPLWAGPNTVRVLVAQANRTAATATQLAAVDDHLSTLAPLGSAVTVASATTFGIAVAATVALKPGWTLDTAMRTEAAQHVDAYTDTLDIGDDMIRNEIVAALMETEGVYDVTALTIDGGTDDVIVVPPTHIAALTGTTLTES